MTRVVKLALVLDRSPSPAATRRRRWTLTPSPQWAA